VGIGTALGAVMALGAAKVLAQMLFVAPFDPLSFALATGVLASAALFANAVPAWSASRVYPMALGRGQT
jgi:ABC-type antimicrobial peptide transport system permease subunit